MTTNSGSIFRSVKIACLQVKSDYGKPKENLSNAEKYLAQAARKGAQLVVCPELLASGYIYSRKLWNYAEATAGITESWLIRMATTYCLYIGAGYLEHHNGHFFNTFTLVDASGKIAARIRKRYLPLFENFLFKPHRSSMEIISTEFGTIAVGICFENYRSDFFNLLQQADPDIILMPHSNPVLIKKKRLTKMVENTMRSIAVFYSGHLNTITVLANKYDDNFFHSPLPILPYAKIALGFTGNSCICKDGEVKASLAGEEGIVFAEVAINHHKTGSARKDPLSGYWTVKPSAYANLLTVSYRLLDSVGKIYYGLARWAYKNTQSKQL